MSGSKELKRNLESLRGALLKLQQPLNASYDAVGQVKRLVNRPQEAAQKLRQIEQTMGTISNLALFLSPFPVIGPIVGRVRMIIDRMVSVVRRISGGIARILDTLRPAQEAVNRVERPIDKARGNIGKYLGTVSGTIAKAEAIERQWPDGPPDAIEKALSAANNLVEPLVGKIVQAQQAIEPGLDGVTTGANAIHSALNPVNEAIDVISSVENALSSLRGPFETIAQVLRPLQWVLDALSVFGYLINKALDPILRALGLDRLIQQLEQLLNPLSRFTEPIERAFDSIRNAISRFGNLDALTRNLDAVSDYMDKVEAAVKPLLTASVTRQILKVSGLQLSKTARGNAAEAKSGARSIKTKSKTKAKTQRTKKKVATSTRKRKTAFSY